MNEETNMQQHETEEFRRLHDVQAFDLVQIIADGRTYAGAVGVVMSSFIYERRHPRYNEKYNIGHRVRFNDGKTLFIPCERIKLLRHADIEDFKE